MLKRIVSIALILALLCSTVQITAIAEDVTAWTTALTQGEIRQARSLIMVEENPSAEACWQEGDSLTSDSNARQVQQYLEWLLDQQIDSLMISVQDTYELSGNKSTDVDKLYVQAQYLRNEVAYYHQLIEENRSNLDTQLNLYEQGGLTDAEKITLARSIRQDVQELESAVEHVLDICAGSNFWRSTSSTYQERLDELRQLLEGQNDAEDEAKLEELSQKAEALTTAEQRGTRLLSGARSASSDPEFTIKVLSSKEFGIEVLDTDGNPINGATVKATVSGVKTKTQTKTTAKGLATFLVKDFSPDSSNTVTVDVEITHADYGTREARKLHINAGYCVDFRLAKSGSGHYLCMVSFNGMDILSQQETIYFSTKNDADLDIEIIPITKDGKGGELVLCYETQEKDGSFLSHSLHKSFSKSGETVTFTEKWCRTLAPSTKLSVELYQSNQKVGSWKTQLVIKQAVVEEPVNKLNQAFSLLSGGISFKLPDEIPFIGGSRLSIDLPVPSYNLYIDPDGEIFFAYGGVYTDDSVNWKKETTWYKQKRADEEGRKTEQAANAAKNQVLTGGTKKSAAFLGAAKATFTAFAAFQGKIGTKPGTVADQSASLSGYVGLQGAFNADYTYNVWISSIPFYLGMDVKFALGVALAFGLQCDWDSGAQRLTNFSINKTSGIIFNILTELGVSAGVGVKGLVSAGVRFLGRLTAMVQVSDPMRASVNLGMELQLVAQILFVKWSQTLWKGTFLETQSNTADYAVSNAANRLQEPDVEKITSGVGVVDVASTGAANDVAIHTHSGVYATEQQLFSQVDSVSQQIQYVTLTSGSTTNTFAFWIKPTGDSDRTAELVWYNMDDTSKHGTVIRGTGTNTTLTTSQTLRERNTDFAFALMGQKDLVAVNVVGGYYNKWSDRIIESSSDIAIMQMTSDGQLQMIRYEQVTELYLKDGCYLAQPMVYLVNHGDSTKLQYYLNVGCAALNRSTHIAQKVYCVDMEYKKNQFKKSKLSTDSFDEGAGMTSFAPTTPTNITASGASLSETQESQRCYYSLSEDETKDDDANGQAYRGKLYLNLNGSSVLLDSDVSFIAPLPDNNITGKGGVDGYEYLFYLKRGKADDGSDCYKLMAARIVSKIGEAAKVVNVDYDINVSSGAFDLVTVDNGTGYGQTYLYWLEQVQEAKDENETVKTHYQVRVVKFERSVATSGSTADNSIMYGPYTLVELSSKPNSVYISPVPDSEGKIQLYYTSDLPDDASADDSADDARISQQLYSATAQLAAGVDIIGVVASDPCVNPGDYAQLLFSVKNTGNLPVAAFAVELLKNGTHVGYVAVACTNPQNDSINTFLSNNAIGFSTTDIDTMSDYSVTRLENVYDDLNGDFWVITESAAITLPTSGQTDSVSVQSSNGGSTSVKTTNMLMPGAVHSYKAVFRVPTDWQGNQKLTVKIANVYPVTNVSNAVMNLAANDEPVSIGDLLGELYCVDENGNAEPVQQSDNDSAANRLSIGRAKSAQSHGDTGAGRGDLTLHCQTYAAEDGRQYVRVNIGGRSTTASNTPPTLIAKLNNTEEVFRHTFQNAIDEDFSYTLDIPADYLLNGAEGGYITFTLYDNLASRPDSTERDLTDAAAEFSEYDNQRTVLVGEVTPLQIVQQPKSASVLAGESVVFTVAATGGLKPYTYQWQRLNADGTWTNIAAATEATFTLSAVGERDHGAQFRCVVWDQSEQMEISAAAMLSVYAAPPATGDEAQPLLWAALAMLSALAVLMIRRRKRA